MTKYEDTSSGPHDLNKSEIMNLLEFIGKQKNVRIQETSGASMSFPFPKYTAFISNGSYWIYGDKKGLYITINWTHDFPKKVQEELMESIPSRDPNYHMRVRWFIPFF